VDINRRVREGKMNSEKNGDVALNGLEPTSDRVLAIDLAKIRPNPFQPRKDFTEEKIDELASSIAACGLIQPIVVRRYGDEEFQLVVGERRYLACKKLGWLKISAAVRTLSDNDMAMLAMIENLQRENLGYLEEAQGYFSLIKKFRLTQEQMAAQMGKSQSTIANKLRLLKLPDLVQKKLIQHGLTERHARALLKLESEKEQMLVIAEVLRRKLTVKQTEQLIDKMYSQGKKERTAARSKPVIRDVRIVLNTIRDAINIIKDSGLNPEVREIVKPEYIEVTIRLNKDKAKKD